MLQFGCIGYIPKMQVWFWYHIGVLGMYPKCRLDTHANVFLLCMLILLHEDPRFFYPSPILIIICTRKYGCLYFYECEWHIMTIGHLLRYIKDGISANLDLVGLRPVFRW